MSSSRRLCGRSASGGCRGGDKRARRRCAEKGCCPFILSATGGVRGHTAGSPLASPRRPGGARRHMAGSPLASPRGAGWIDYPACALTLADCISARPIAFFACAAGGQEDPRVGPSCQSPRPKGAFPASGLHPSNVRTTDSLAPLLKFVPSHGGWNKFHLAFRTSDYRGQFRVSQPKAQAIRSSPVCASTRVRPFSFAEARGAAGCVRAFNKMKPLAVSTSILNS